MCAQKYFKYTLYLKTHMRNLSLSHNHDVLHLPSCILAPPVKRCIIHNYSVPL